jgi:hypothetical protein
VVSYAPRPMSQGVAGFDAVIVCLERSLLESGSAEKRIEVA